MKWAACASLVALFAALAVSGCARMHGLATQASPADAGALAARQSLADANVAAGAWPRSDWWRRFNDPQLDQLMDEALAGSPTLRVASARVRQALSAVQIADAARGPKLNADAELTRERFPAHSLVPPPIGGTWKTQANLQATANYEFDFWGRNRAAYDSALGQARAAGIDAFAARLALSVNVAQTYAQLQRACLQLEVAQQTLKDRVQFHALTQQRFAAGVDSNVAVNAAESALPPAREAVAQLQESAGLARNQLAALLGKGPDRGAAIAPPAANALGAPDIPSALPAELLGRRPDILAQRWRVEAAARDIDVARAQFYPNVNLSAFAGFQSIGLPGFLRAANRTLGAEPAVTLPIFDGGRLRGNLAGRNAEYDAAVEQYNQTLADALRDVVDQLTTLQSLREQRRQQDAALATARDTLKLATLRYQEGAGNYLDTLNADLQLRAQQSQDVDLRARELALSINLMRALGGGFEPSSAPLAGGQAQSQGEQRQ